MLGGQSAGCFGVAAAYFGGTHWVVWQPTERTLLPPWVTFVTCPARLLLLLPLVLRNIFWEMHVDKYILTNTF